MNKYIQDLISNGTIEIIEQTQNKIRCNFGGIYNRTITAKNVKELVEKLLEEEYTDYLICFYDTLAAREFMQAELEEYTAEYYDTYGEFPDHNRYGPWEAEDKEDYIFNIIQKYKERNIDIYEEN